MFGYSLEILLPVIGISFLAAAFAVWMLSRKFPDAGKSPYEMMADSRNETAFLFDDQVLIDATRSARKMLAPKTDDITDWQRFLTAFGARFSTLADDLSALGEAGSLTILPDDPNDSLCIEAEWWNGLARLSVKDADGTDASEPVMDRNSLTALESELELLRNTAKLAPYLIWQESGDGKIIWANSAYLSLVSSLLPRSAADSWPPPRLFNGLSEVGKDTADPAGTDTIRLSAEDPKTGHPKWFDVLRKQINGTTLCFATPADEIVKAENSLKDFVQTLTKTFAHLSIGLAVFDKNRQLAIFNPALIDLTKLPADFLSMRPTLFSFLDRLRENRTIPEPKDYKSWRQQMIELEIAATDGTYEETWSLPSGQTYRVNGRPHANGAVALLFEDISDEVSLTRNFREELEVGQAVLDTLDDAVVVFSSSGLITMTNKAYVSLWGVDPSTTFGEMGVTDATRNWQEICDPTPLWDELQTFINTPGKRTEWQGKATLDDGRPLNCHFMPLAGGATMVRFSIANIPAKPVGKRRRTGKQTSDR